MFPSASFPEWICCQLGAREHYAVPRALRHASRKVTLNTDFWSGPLTRSILGKCGLKKVTSLASRWHPELCNGKAEMRKESQTCEVQSWNWRALWWELIKRNESQAGGRRQIPSNLEASIEISGIFAGYLEVGQRFARCVRDKLERTRNLSERSIVFAYDTGALEIFEWCREHNIKCVLNQMDPGKVEVDLVQTEEKNWPGWALEPLTVPDEYFHRRKREWALAHRVVVNSEFSRQALLQQGVPEEKMSIIPLCYEINGNKAVSSPKSRASAETLRVLFLGQVILRKGIQYLIAAARELEHTNVHFDIVGPVGISTKAMDTAPANMTFHGRIGRNQASSWYQRSHLFVLPTLSDGFAITQLEAMANGLPVVTTPNCGDVVTNGKDGFIISARDSDALVRAFKAYLQEPELLAVQSAAAMEKARLFSLNSLAEKLVRLESELK